MIPPAAPPPESIAAKDVIGWVLTAVGLLFVFVYSKCRLDRTARLGVAEKFRDLVIEIEEASLASLRRPGTDPEQMERYIGINSQFKRLQGYVLALRSCRCGADFGAQVKDLKRIVTGGDAQSTTRVAAAEGEGRLVALAHSVNSLLEALDTHMTRRSWFG